MSDGVSVSLALKLTPAEARGFARVFEELADLAEAAEEDGGALHLDCAGAA